MKRFVFLPVFLFMCFLTYSQTNEVKSNLILIKSESCNPVDNQILITDFLRDNGYRIDRKKTKTDCIVTRPEKLITGKKTTKYILRLSLYEDRIEARCEVLDLSLSGSWLRASSLSPEESPRKYGWNILTGLTEKLQTIIKGKIYYEREPEIPVSKLGDFFLG